MSRRVAVAALVVIALAPRARACECPIPGPESAIAGAQFIFAGQVERAEGGRRTVRVMASWRGDFSETTVVRMSGVCGIDLQVGREYLIFIREGMEIHMCSGTRPFDFAYVERYLLGEPETAYDPAMEIVTEETLFQLLGNSSVVEAFGRLKIDPDHALPRLESIALGETAGHRVGAIEAIGGYGTSGRRSYSTLKSIFDDPGYDPDLRAAALEAMLGVTRDFSVVRPGVCRAFRDPEPQLRIAALHCADSAERWPGIYTGPMRRERLRCLHDPVADVRYEALRFSMFQKNDRAILDRIHEMSCRDSNERVQREARKCLEFLSDRTQGVTTTTRPSKDMKDPRTRVP